MAALVTAPNDTVELRLVVPREMFATTTQPEFFSQLNCGLLGITKRAFLELLRRSNAPPVSPVGKMRLVRRDDMLAFLHRIAQTQAKLSAPPLDGADRVLAEIGCVVPRRR